MGPPCNCPRSNVNKISLNVIGTQYILMKKSVKISVEMMKIQKLKDTHCKETTLFANTCIWKYDELIL